MPKLTVTAAAGHFILPRFARYRLMPLPAQFANTLNLEASSVGAAGNHDERRSGLLRL